MNVVLSGDAQRFVEEKVRSGQYSSPDEAVNALIGLAQEQEVLSAEDLAALRSEIDVGLDEANSGQFVEFSADEIISEGRAALKAKRGNG